MSGRSSTSVVWGLRGCLGVHEGTTECVGGNLEGAPLGAVVAGVVPEREAALDEDEAALAAVVDSVFRVSSPEGHVVEVRVFGVIGTEVCVYGDGDGGEGVSAVGAVLEFRVSGHAAEELDLGSIHGNTLLV